MRWSRVAGIGLTALAIGGCGATRMHPAATGTGTGSSSGLPVVPVSYDGAVCAPGWSSLRAGTYEFALEDRGQDSTAMTLLNAIDDVPVSSTTPVTPGSRSSVRVRLRAGLTYQWRCQTSSQAPGLSVAIKVAHANATTLPATPGPISTAQLEQPLSRYVTHERELLTRLRAELAVLTSRLTAGNVAGAKSAWLTAHLSWLRLGQDDGAYGAFGDLGSRIDGTAAGHVGTTRSPDFTGFHRVELALWHHDLAEARSQTATLRRRVGSINRNLLATDFPQTTVGLDAWALRCHEILEDALRDTLTGEDDYGSHSALASVGADVGATREMLSVLSGLIAPRAPGLVGRAEAQLNRLDRAIRPVRAVRFSALPAGRRRDIDADIDAALSTLAPVSELIQVSSANS
jgi:high-affinity iron transporter